MKPKFSLFGPLWSFSAFVFTVSFASLASAQDGSWISDAAPASPNNNLNWSNTANWNPAAVPGGVGSTVTIGSDITANRTVTIDSTSRTVGTLNIGDLNRTHNFTLARTLTATLTFDNGAAAAALNAVATSASDTISVPIVLGSTQNGAFNITNNHNPLTGTTDRTLTLSGGITTTGALARTINVSGTSIRGNVSISGVINQGGTPGSTISLTKSGVNTLSLGGANVFSGGVTLNEGTLNLNAAGALGGASAGQLTINGGSIGSTGGAAVALTGNSVQSWAGNFGFSGFRSLNMGTGAVTMTGSRTITLNGTYPTSTSFVAPIVTVGGVISDGGSAYSLTTQVSGTNATGGILLRLNGANTYSGGTNINGGTVEFGAGSVPTTGTITVGDKGALSVAGAFTTLNSVLTDSRFSNLSTGALALTGSSSENFSPAGTNAASTLSLGAAYGSTVVYTGNINRGTTGYFVGGGGGSIEFSNADAFTGSTTLRVGNGGGGTTIISNSNSIDGLTSVGGGTILSLRHSSALGSSAGGVTVDQGGGVDLNGGVEIAEALTIQGTNSNASPYNVTASLANSGGNNKWTGNIAATVTNGNNVRIATSGGNLEVSGTVSVTTSASNANGQSLVLTGDGGTGTISGVISASSGITTAIIKNGSSAWTLSGTNTFQGAVRVDDGVLSVGSIANNLGVGTSAIGLGENTASGTLRYTGTTTEEITARGLSLRSGNTGNGTVEQAGTGHLRINGTVTATSGGRTLTLTGSTAGTGEIGGVIGGASNASINVVKSGTGAWTLSGANNYTGATTVNAGTLTVTGAINSSTALNVTGGTFAWGASNVLAGAVTLSGGLLQTNGFSDALGVLTLTGASQISMEGPTGSIIAFGNSSAATWTAPGTLSILNWTGSLTGGGADQITFDAAGLTGSQLSKIFFVDPNGNTGTYSAVFVGNEIVPGALIPEPSVMLLGALGGVGMALRRRRAGK